MAKKSIKKKNSSVSEGLAHFLADTAVLYFSTLNFHWNMTGSQFYMYHKLLEEQYKELAEAMDEVAERIRMLGEKAPGSMKHFLQLTCLKEYSERLSQEEMVQELVQGHTSLSAHCLELIKTADAAQDVGTSDLLIQRMRSHDKNAWLLRAHIEKF